MQSISRCPRLGWQQIKWEARNASYKTVPSSSTCMWNLKNHFSFGNKKTLESTSMEAAAVGSSLRNQAELCLLLISIALFQHYGQRHTLYFYTFLHFHKRKLWCEKYKEQNLLIDDANVVFFSFFLKSKTKTLSNILLFNEKYLILLEYVSKSC